MKVYAGVGSRETPFHILDMMQNVGCRMQDNNYILRSGGAAGADTAFATFVGPYYKQIYRPEHCKLEWLDLAARYHPAWDRCSDYAKRLHGRNCGIVLGSDLNDPVEFIVCWTKDGKATGGTGQALRVAEAFKIPVWNFYYANHREAWGFQ